RVESYEGASVAEADAAIDRLVASGGMVPVNIDTRLDLNSTGLRNAAEVESQLARMDVVITTRLHGMVLALKNGVPVVAIDPQTSGGKILRQAETIGWPLVLREDTLSDEALVRAFEYCLTTAAQGKARECAARARDAVQGGHHPFISALARSPSSAQTPNSRELVRSMASNLAADVPRSPSPDTVPACFKVVFQRARTTNWPLG